jgi:HEAT repeat protein
LGNRSASDPSRAVSSRKRKGSKGNPGYAGYEYQIDVTIWIALDSMLAKAGTNELNIEPPSHEDLEASIQNPSNVLLDLTAQAADRIDLIFQVKTRSGSPWSSIDIAKILTGKDHKKGYGDRRRMRPLDMLTADARRRYVFITNEALSQPLRVHQGQHVLDFPEVADLPPYTRKGYDAAAQAALAPRILLCSGVTEEVLQSRIDSLLSRHGHVPSINRAACLKDLREEVRKRIRGHNGGRWTRTELVATLAHHDGSVAPTRAMDHYVPPRSFDRILEKLEKSHAVVIAGPSGTGKTLTADILEIRLRQAAPPFEIVGEELGPGHVRHRLTQAGAVLFHLRDPWGSNRLTPGAERWSGEVPKLLTSAGPERKFVITSRSDVLQSAGREIMKALAPYTVSIEIEDYGRERIEEIYDGIAGDLTGHARLLARGYRETALKSLHRPYEIDRFLVALSREDSKKPRKAEDIVSESQIEAISGVIARQIEPLGDDGVASAAVLWALLAARGAVIRDVFSKLLRRMRHIDNSFRPDVEGLIDFLVAGRNLRQDGTSLSLYHPRVEGGLRMAFMRRRNEAEYVLSLVVDGLATLDSTGDDWGIETGLAVCRATEKLDGLRLSLAPVSQARLDDHLDNNAMAADRRFDFERALTDLARFGSAVHIPSRLARALLDGGPRTGKPMFKDCWGPPALSETEMEDLRRDARTTPLIERFVREVMPFTQTHYDPAVARLLLQLAPGVGPSFWDALDTVAGPGGPNENIKAIVAGACAGDSPDFDRAIARCVQSEAEADAWMEMEYAEEARKAEEHEVDAVAADHILEEPQERYYNAQAGMEAIVELRRQDEEFGWIAQHPHRQPLISAAAKMITNSPVTPNYDDLRLMLEKAEGGTRGALWRAVNQHWCADLADLLMTELAKSGLGTGLRGTLVEVAAKTEEHSGDPVPLLAEVARQVPPERQIEMVYDLIRTSLDDQRGESGNATRRERAERLCNTLSSPTDELGRLLVALLSGAEIGSSARKLSRSAESSLTVLLPALSLDVAGPLLCAAASIGLDIVPTAKRLLSDGDADDGSAAIQTLTIVANENSHAILREALGHERYRVRRAALEALIQAGDPQDRDLVLSAASDPSADMRLAWARVMQECRWPEAVDALVGLLGDQRDFNNNPGYMRGSWSEFRVARAAARALGAFEILPEKAVSSLLEAAQGKLHDPFVACAAVRALADKDDGRISDAINVALESLGMRGAPQYRPLSQSAAWALFDRAVVGKHVQLSPTAIQMAAADSPVVAGPLLITAGVLGGEARDVLVHRLDEPSFAARAELLRVAMIVAGSAGDLVHEGCEPILVKLAAGVELEDLSLEERVEVETWSKNLEPERDVQRYTAWIAETFLDLPLAHDIGDPRALDLPRRIGVMTMRSLTPAREEGPDQDDGQ